MNNPVTITYEMVTPAIARQWLDTSIGNRPINAKSVALYMQLMRDGQWEPTTHSIFFDENGHLMDGHHRLHAVIKSGLMVPMEVKRNYLRANWSNLTTGEVWTVGELAAGNGIKSPNVAMGAVRIRECLKRGLRLGVLGTTLKGSIQGHIWTKDDYINLYREEADWAEDVESAVCLYRNWHGISPSMCAGVLHHLVRDCHWGRNFVLEFFRQTYTLDRLTPNTQTLRKRLDFDRGSGLALLPNYICLLISKAFDGYVSNTPKSKLAVKDIKATPSFPKFI